jgi:hypothetical protein
MAAWPRIARIGMSSQKEFANGALAPRGEEFVQVAIKTKNPANLLAGCSL